MAERESAQRRSAARQRRRGETAQSDDRDGDGNESPGSTESLKHAAKVAAAAAALGAAVGAARALTSDDEPTDDDDDEPATEEREPPAVDRAPAEREPEPAAPKEAEESRDDRDGRALGIGDAQRFVRRARGFLEELQGKQAESVSSVARAPDGWRVNLEVLELSRIPETTDILATYEVTLDDDGNLVRYERTRRYHRSQADQGADG